MISKADLLDMARRKSAGYPAYVKEFDRPIWSLVQLTSDVDSPLGRLFKRGDITIARYGRDIPDTPPNLANTLFAFSFRIGGERSIQSYNFVDGENHGNTQHGSVGPLRHQR